MLCRNFHPNLCLGLLSQVRGEGKGHMDTILSTGDVKRTRSWESRRSNNRLPSTFTLLYMCIWPSVYTSCSILRCVSHDTKLCTGSSLPPDIGKVVGHLDKPHPTSSVRHVQRRRRSLRRLLLTHFPISAQHSRTLTLRTCMNLIK